MPPELLWGELCLAYVHSQTNALTCTKFGANQHSRLTASPDFWICDPLPPPPPNAPWGIEGWLVFSLCPFPYESADVNQSWGQSNSFPILLNCWPPKPRAPPPPPKCPPCVSKGNLFGVYPFPYEFAHMCLIWCQSAQPFGSFSRIYAKVSSAFCRCTRWLAQNTSKNNIYTSKIMIPARTCRHQRH